MKRKGMNKFQKAAFKPGEHKTRTEDIHYYLTLAQSDDPADRLEAAENLCPCHVRRRVGDVWQALYLMMEDPDDLVRRAAWHTLEDGGVPDDPAIAPIFQRAVQRLDQESDQATQNFIKQFALPYVLEQSEVEFQKDRLSTNRYAQLGKCDFCGRSSQRVRTDFDTEITRGEHGTQFALICQPCDAQQESA